MSKKCKNMGLYGLFFLMLNYGIKNMILLLKKSYFFILTIRDALNNIKIKSV